MELTIENAVKTAKAAVEWSGKENLTCRLYEKYRKKFGGPSTKIIFNKMKWTEFKAKYLGIKIISQKERMEKELTNNFCEYCKFKEHCTIKLENCNHWKYWNNRKRREG